jgi:hypothetical protein
MANPPRGSGPGQHNQAHNQGHGNPNANASTQGYINPNRARPAPHGGPSQMQAQVARVWQGMTEQGTRLADLPVEDQTQLHHASVQYLLARGQGHDGNLQGQSRM